MELMEMKMALNVTLHEALPNGVEVFFAGDGTISVFDEEGRHHLFDWRLCPGVQELPTKFWRSGTALFALYSDRIVRINNDLSVEIAVDIPAREQN